MIRLFFFKSILRQDISFFDMNSAGELNTRLADDINKISAGISDKISISIQMTCRSITGLVIGFVYGWQLALVIFAVSPLLVASATVMFKLTTAFTKREIDAYAKAGSVAEEVISSIRTVAAFAGQEKECDRYNKNLVFAKQVGKLRGIVQGLGLGTTYLIMFSTYGLAFWYGSSLITNGALEIGDMLTTFFSILVGAFSLGGAASNMEYFAAAKAAAYKIFEIIDREPEIDSSSDEGHKPDKVNGEIEFKNVHFTYPSRPDIEILKGVSLTINKGETTAFCGQSGCGKSTCIQLIQRFYDPQKGSVFLDGHDIRSLNVRWLRQNIGVVAQEPILFDTTIGENIKFGRDGVTDEEMIKATKEANIYDFISKLPLKFDTIVGEGGAQMSGGQKQRIAIARAIVRNPKIMLLDEATSALDTESEAIVQAALERASEGRTTIVIAHRLSTIKNSDKIIGFHEGEALESGNHNELLKVKNGIYQNLVHMQTYESESTEKGDEEKKSETFQEKNQLRKRILSVKSVTSEKEETVEAEEVEEDLPDIPFSRVFKMNKPEICYIIAGCLGAAVNGGIQPCFSILFSELLKVFQQPVINQNDINLYSGLFVAIGVCAFIANTVQASMFARSGEELTARIRALGFKSMLRQQMAYFDDHMNSTGALTTRLATDASKVQGITGVRLGSIIQSFFALGVALGIAFVSGWQLTFVTLAFVPFMILAGMITMKILTGKSGSESKAFERSGKISQEATVNIRTVVSLTKERHIYQNFEDSLELPNEQAVSKAWLYGVAFGFSQCIIFFAYAATFRFGGWLVGTDKMTSSNVYRCMMSVIFGAFAVGQSSSFLPDFAEGKIATNRLFKLIDSVPKIDSSNPDGTVIKKSEGRINFKSLKFHYPTRPDVKVLKDLNAAIKPGNTVAFVGQSGCGKSTCIQLLERFYDPTDGSVLLDGNKVDEMQIANLRSHFGIVSQEPVLFDRSIKENIQYGDNSREADMDEIITAAKNANIHSFISGLPEQYETNVGSKGTQLSGGQKQRIAIARALLRNPRVLLLDEATSALDTESEKIVQQALDAASQGRTCIIIAHRLSTIKNADAIFVIENGRVVESGTHDELLSKQGSYYSLVNAQLNAKSS